MTPQILLLDCPYTLQEKLKRQGFSVDMGTIGFCGGVRNLPCQIYEREVIIYNPTFIARTKNGFIASHEINDLTPEYGFANLKDHVMKGATVLIFANHLDDGVDPNHVYEWFPLMPRLMLTKDQQALAAQRYEHWHEEFLRPTYLQNEIQLPVRIKLKHRNPPKEGADDIEEVNNTVFEVVPLFFNKNDDVLGASFRFGAGYFFLLPTFNSNDDVIVTFLNKIVPKIYKIETRKNIIDDFFSPKEHEIQKEIDEMSAISDGLGKRLEVAKETLVQTKMTKTNVIREDETAVLVLNYYELAQQQSDVALFFIYKIIEVLEKKYGSEANAKRILKNNEGWNLIGRIANASYGDVRHAPKPGEKVKEWSSEEIKACFETAKQISMAYFATLFETEPAQNEITNV